MPSMLWFRSTAPYGFYTKVARLGLQDPTRVVIRQVRHAFSYNKLLSSLPFSTITDINIFIRPGAIFAGSIDSLVCRKRNISVVAAVSRAFSTPSVSGPAYQICGYHIDRLLSDTTYFPSAGENQKLLMVVVSSPKVAIGDCIVPKLISSCCFCASLKDNASIFYCKKGFKSCSSASMSLKNHEQPNHASIFGYLLYNAIRSGYKPYVRSWFNFNELDISSTSTYTTDTVEDDIINGSMLKDKLENSMVSSEGTVSSGTALKLISGSCCMPHPDKEETGGEDAHFICAEEQAIGVADGVGGWAEFGVDAGQYARELMSNAVTAVREEPKGSIDPARVLEKAHSSTKVKGSSTACIIALNDEGLHAVNLGDSGFIVVRDGCIVFRSPAQQHDFNFTFQLESGDAGDLPSSGQVFSVPVAPGDVVIAGTDGLFDNLYSNEVTAVVVQALRAGLGPEVTAQKIAALARQRAQDREHQTPFSIAAQDAGFRYLGGKLDDITVVVSLITSYKKEDNSLPPAHGSR